MNYLINLYNSTWIGRFVVTVMKIEILIVVFFNLMKQIYGINFNLF